MSEPSDPSGLHEYVDAEIELSVPATPAQEQALEAALREQKGVQNVSIANKKISVNYDPLDANEKELLAAIERVGLKVASERVTPSSTLTDAFEKDLQAPGSDRVDRSQSTATEP